MTAGENIFIKHDFVMCFEKQIVYIPRTDRFQSTFPSVTFHPATPPSDDLWVLKSGLLFPHLVVLGSLSGLHLSAVGFMGAVSADPIITFLTCTVNLYSMNQSPEKILMETLKYSLLSVCEGGWFK